jgi:hypothetical protein
MIMDIRISSESVDALDHEGLAILFYSDERPPGGFCGRVDWRMNGLISRHMAGGLISGAYEERVLFTPYRIGCGKLFLFGMGSRRDLTRERMRDLGRSMGTTLSAVGVRRLACHITGKPPYPFPVSEMTAAAVSGLIEPFFRDGVPFPLDITCIVDPADLRDEILLGLYQLKVTSKSEAGVRIHH